MGQTPYLVLGIQQRQDTSGLSLQGTDSEEGGQGGQKAAERRKICFIKTTHGTEEEQKVGKFWRTFVKGSIIKGL